MSAASYLDHLDGVEEGEGERDQHQQQRADCEDVGDNAGTLITHHCTKVFINLRDYTHSTFYTKCGVGRNSQCYYCAGNMFQIAHSVILQFYILYPQYKAT